MFIEYIDIKNLIPYNKLSKGNVRTIIISNRDFFNQQGDVYINETNKSGCLLFGKNRLKRIRNGKTF